MFTKLTTAACVAAGGQHGALPRPEDPELGSPCGYLSFNCRVPLRVCLAVIPPVGVKASDTLNFSFPLSSRDFLPVPVGFSGTLTLPAAVGFRVAGLNELRLPLLAGAGFGPGDVADLQDPRARHGDRQRRRPVRLVQLQLAFFDHVVRRVLAIETASTAALKTLSLTAFAIRSRTV